MTNPFRDIGDGGAHVRWPVWVSVLKLQPRKHVLEFIREQGRRNHRDRCRDHTEQKAWRTESRIGQDSEDAKPSR